MPSRTYPLSPLFPEGLVTDRDSGLLRPTEASVAQDCVWSTDGDLCKRGAFMYATGANPLNGNTSKITSCVLWYDGTTPILAVGDAAGRLSAISSYSYSAGTATTSTASSAYATGSSSPVWPVVVYDNEIICVNPTARTTPIIRWSGATGAVTSGAGTVSAGGDDDRVQGAGTNFLTRFSEANRYIVITDDNGIAYYYRVAKVESDTLLRVSSPINIPLDTGMSWSSSPFGYFNLCNVIDDRGRVTNSTTTVTGDSTGWLDAYVAVGSSDIIGQTAVGTRWNIASVADDNTLTTSVSPSGWSANKQYEILRRQSGHVVCEHQNRLHVSGHVTYPNRVYVFPAGASANVEANGIDSYTTDPLSASQAEYVDVPSTTDDGGVVAMVSVREPGGLAVFRDRDFYMVYGEWPSVQVQKISGDIGCVHWRGACEIPGGVAWMGYEGVYIHRPGGGIENITDGKIANEYRFAIKNANTSMAPQDGTQPHAQAIGYVEDHLIVTIGDSATSPTTSSTVYAYNMQTKAWAKWTGVAPMAMSKIVLSRNSQELLLADANTNRQLGVSTAAQWPSTMGSASGVNGTFSVTSGGNIFGGRGNLGRVIDMKLTHSVAGSSPQLLVRFGATTAATIGSGSNPTTTRIRPGSTQMGVAQRQQTMQFLESSGTFTTLRLKEVSITQRLRRARA